jgi:hypothetical protein
MAGIGDGDLVGRRGRRAKADRRGARRNIRHRQTFAGARSILRCSRRDQRAQQGKHGREASQHGRAHAQVTPAL